MLKFLERSVGITRDHIEVFVRRELERTIQGAVWLVMNVLAWRLILVEGIGTVCCRNIRF